MLGFEMVMFNNTLSGPHKMDRVGPVGDVSVLCSRKRCFLDKQFYRLWLKRPNVRLYILMN